MDFSKDEPAKHSGFKVDIMFIMFIYFAKTEKTSQKFISPSSMSKMAAITTQFVASYRWPWVLVSDLQ